MKFEKIVDLHCHILPNIDDGSPDLEHSIQLANDAIKDGVTHILATPHHLDRNYINHKADVIEYTNAFQKELDDRGIELKVFPGQEVHINGELIKNYDDLLGADERKRYMMLEFPHSNVPAYAKRIIFDLQKAGTIPVIVHPERNKEIQGDLNILYDFIEQGALAQLTATSYVGGFGKEVEEASKKMIEHNLIHVIASDAHSLNGRDFVLREGLEKIGRDFDEDIAYMFEKNAETILNGDYLTPFEPIKIQKKKRFFFF